MLVAKHKYMENCIVKYVCRIGCYFFHSVHLDKRNSCGSVLKKSICQLCFSRWKEIQVIYMCEHCKFIYCLNHYIEHLKCVNANANHRYRTIKLLTYNIRLNKVIMHYNPLKIKCGAATLTRLNPAYLQYCPSYYIDNITPRLRVKTLKYLARINCISFIGI